MRAALGTLASIPGCPSSPSLFLGAPPHLAEGAPTLHLRAERRHRSPAEQARPLEAAALWVRSQEYCGDHARPGSLCLHPEVEMQRIAYTLPFTLLLGALAGCGNVVTEDTSSSSSGATGGGGAGGDSTSAVSGGVTTTTGAREGPAPSPRTVSPSPSSRPKASRSAARETSPRGTSKTSPFRRRST